MGGGDGGDGGDDDGDDDDDDPYSIKVSLLASLYAGGGW